MAVTAPVTPALSARRRAAARARWGPQRIVRLDDLTPPQRRLVLALVEAAMSENKSAGPTALASVGPATAQQRVEDEPQEA